MCVSPPLPHRVSGGTQTGQPRDERFRPGLQKALRVVAAAPSVFGLVHVSMGAEGVPGETLSPIVVGRGDKQPGRPRASLAASTQAVVASHVGVRIALQTPVGPECTQGRCRPGLAHTPWRSPRRTGSVGSRSADRDHACDPAPRRRQPSRRAEPATQHQRRMSLPDGWHSNGRWGGVRRGPSDEARARGVRSGRPVETTGGRIAHHRGRVEADPQNLTGPLPRRDLTTDLQDGAGERLDACHSMSRSRRDRTDFRCDVGAGPAHDRPIPGGARPGPAARQHEVAPDSPSTEILVHHQQPMRQTRPSGTAPAPGDVRPQSVKTKLGDRRRSGRRSASSIRNRRRLGHVGWPRQ